ncbi:glycine cleavage system aminomethyltransferase GcvT [Verrucomicrobiaceae bacterium N1E253]|uniref:Aminomethyltransferase n=1 Tax=Oceaniferula marina TaxID=2748318 RepID=A0A851GP11_9BACT|nr:glycine cleavage system aminomethyltransferase GcvT [Oceaniferula marina]NWK56767.1 glycine cleavage system aminomethyltransferase GcvT [Oceaniferula marina]
MSEIIQETPLAALHVELGAKMIPFAGWNMPVQYTSIMDEHTAVREAVGIFDISHMGQFFLVGEGAEEWLNTILTNDIAKLEPGQGQYTFMLNENGGVIDDLIIYRQAPGRIFLVVNASMIDEDYAWLEKALPDGLTLTNESDSWAGMAVQGPNSPGAFAALFPGVDLPPRNGLHTWEQDGETLVVCRTGYTGEDGYEFFSSAGNGSAWFQRFVDAGAKPCGLGARDTLRLEVCYPLNGSDLSPERTPRSAGLGFAVSLTKECGFIGKDVVMQEKEDGFKERLIALEYTGKGAPPRAHYEVFTKEGERLTELTSGVLSPSLKQGIAMAYLPVDYAKIGTLVDIDVRGRRFEAKVVKKPFYKKG